MVWFKIDDGFWSHPKVLELSDSATALWTRAGSYCAGHLTDGVVKRSTLRVLAADRDAAVELVLAGLWDETATGWSFHDWDEYQPTREEVLKERAAATERKRVSRERSRKPSQVESHRDVQGTDGVSHASPTRPDPTPVTTPNGVVTSPRKRGERMPDQFFITSEMRSWAATNTPAVPIEEQTHRFADYWRAQPGQRGVKTDWTATWRNWMRKASDDIRPGPGKPLTRTEQNMSVVAEIAAREALELRGIEQ